MKSSLSFNLLLAALVLVTRVSSIAGQRVVCYYGSWSVYNEGLAQFFVSDIDPYLCTHVIYSFVGLGNDNKVKVLDPSNDLEDNGGFGNMKKFTGLKTLNPQLRTMLAIGGWGEGSVQYSDMVSSAENRTTFINSILPLMESQNFDGLDVDWEYPTERGGKPEDRENFDLLLEELKAEFESRGYLLSAAIGGNIGDELITKCYNVANLGRTLDFINVMTYDYHEAENDGYAHHHSPLYEHSEDAAHNIPDFNTDHTMRFLVDSGAPAEKLNLGIGCYGRGVSLADENVNGIYAPSTGPIPGGPFLGGPGYWGYHEICATVGPEQWTVVRLEGQITSPYAYKGKNWIGYDDPESVTIKTQYAKDQGFGGVFTWAIDTDDFHGSCHGETFPLVRTMGRTLVG